MGRGEERLMAVAYSGAVGRWQMPQCVPGDEEWERRSSLKYLRAQENLVSSDKRLFLTQTSLECLYFGEAEGGMSSVEGASQPHKPGRYLAFSSKPLSPAHALFWNGTGAVWCRSNIEQRRTLEGDAGTHLLSALPPHPTHTVKWCEGSPSVGICLCFPLAL